MANFKLVISDPKSRKAWQKETDQAASGIVGKKIGETFNGDSLGLSGFELEVTGGSDKEGFPMRRDVDGQGRKRIILTSPPGFHPKTKGQRRRKSVRGNMVSTDIVQVNLKITKHGSKSADSLLGKKEEKKEAEEPKAEAPKTEEKKEESKPAEAPKQEPKTEEKKEEPKPAEKKPEEKPKEEKPADKKPETKK